jgi:glycosyltransferase involved in cell wall biosynthesis
MALIPLTMAPYAILRSGVVAMGGIKDVFFTRIFPTLWTLTGGILLLSAWGIAGANVASIVGNLIGLYLIVRVLKRKGIFVSVQNTVAETTAITADSITESDVAPDPIDENAPGISVIMPAYNSTKYIGEAIQSILNQTYTKWELIVVDDGSTDDTVQVVQKYIDQDSRIRLYKNEHGGPSQARNTAIEHAQYDWLALLDADDIALPQRFAKQIAAATADPEVAVWGSFVSHINAKGKILSIHKVGPTSILEFQEQLKKGYVPQVINPSVLMKKEMINKVGDYDKDFPAAQDLELFDRIAQHGPIVAVSEVLTYYRVHGDAISMSKFFTQRELAAYVRLRSQNRISGTETPSLADYLSAQKQTSLVNRMMKRHSDYYAYFYRRAGHEYSQDHFIRACWYLTVSSFLNPRYALRRVWKQKLAPNLSSLKLGVLSRARALPFWANSPRTDMP